MSYMMQLLFIFLYVTANELTYMIALRQQMGLCRHISAGGLCWINRIIMAVPCVWYCGWIVGFVLIAFALFGLLHATVGWILTIPTLSIMDERKLFHITDVECGLLIPVNLICLAFTILSFFRATYKSALSLIAAPKQIVIIVAVLAIGFAIRAVVFRRFQ
ncbi:MAG: hypothetical protein IJV40_02905 [Oscillospiraceae bacterium]|nr:hypothetical protein [Oscillospiraceae bacterium]